MKKKELVNKILELIEAISKRGTTILLVEQNVTRALSLAHRGYVVESGVVSMEGAGEDLLRSEYLKKAYLGM